MEQRYVYYKVPRERLASACAAVRAAQQAWSDRVPGLQAQLMLRCDDEAAPTAATLMEIWSWEPSGPAPASAACDWSRLEAELHAALGHALLGERHVEAFRPAAA